MSIGQMSTFAESEGLEKLAKADNIRARLNASVEWSIFRRTLTTVFEKEAKGAGDHRPDTEAPVEHSPHPRSS